MKCPALNSLFLDFPHKHGLNSHVWCIHWHSQNKGRVWGSSEVWHHFFNYLLTRIPVENPCCPINSLQLFTPHSGFVQVSTSAGTVGHAWLHWTEDIPLFSLLCHYHCVCSFLLPIQMVFLGFQRLSLLDMLEITLIRAATLSPNSDLWIVSKKSPLCGFFITRGTLLDMFLYSCQGPQHFK